MQKKIIINNKIYSQTDALKLLKLSKSHYYTLKENVGFELKHLSDNTLSSLKKELKQSLKKWKQARIETRKWLVKFNKKHGLSITVIKLKKAIRDHNKYRRLFRSNDINKLTYSNISKNKYVFNNPNRLIQPREYFKLRSDLFFKNCRLALKNFIGDEAFNLIQDLSQAELIDMAMDVFDGVPLVEYYNMTLKEFQTRIADFLDYIAWRRENFPNADTDAHNISGIATIDNVVRKYDYTYWQTNVKGSV